MSVYSLLHIHVVVLLTLCSELRQKGGDSLLSRMFIKAVTVAHAPQAMPTNITTTQKILSTIWTDLTKKNTLGN